MSNSRLKSFYPHLVALGIFFVLALAYFPAVLSGKKAAQHDVQMWRGAYQEMGEFQKKTGEVTLWSNSMFGGMPTYTFGGLVTKSASITNFIEHYFIKLGLPSPIDTVWLLMLCFYILLITFGVSPYIAIIGAIAYAFASFNFVNIDAGHITKGNAIAYLPLLFAALNIILRYNKWVGAAMMALACALEYNAGHLQITYYGAILIMIWGIAHLVMAIKEKTIPHFVLCVLLAAAGAGVGFATQVTALMVNDEYVKESQRSPSELKGAADEVKGTGLSPDYAFEYSYTVYEPLTILVSDIYGGASASALGKSSNTYKALKANGIDETRAKGFCEQAPTYWGTLRITSGPTYFGAIVCFLFVLGLFVVKGPEKWWLLGGAILSVLLSYGRYFPTLSYFFFDHFPFYNKFRSVTFILTIAQFCFPVLGMLALKEFIFSKQPKEKLRKSLLMAFAAVGGLLLLIILVALGNDDFSAQNDAKMQLPEWLLEALKKDRQSMAVTGAFRSLVFIGLAVAALFLLMSKKLKENYALLIIGALVLTDLWMVDKHYLNDKDFTGKKSNKEAFNPTTADQQILQDTTPDFRVFNVTVSPFNDASTSYFHKSIGGYSAVKLRRYQDLIDRQIGNNNMQVLNMLNTRYFIVEGENKEPVAQRNPNAMGNAWFVPRYVLVPDANAEMDSLSIDTLGGGFNPRNVAFVDQRYAAQVNGFTPQFDSSATINLTEYKPNHLTYLSNAGSEQLAIFSEIYYEKGWNAYIDGKEVPHFRANYVLRAMRVPTGTHKIEFKFEPATYARGEKISWAFTGILYVSVVAAAGFMFLRRRKGEGDKK